MKKEKKETEKQQLYPFYFPDIDGVGRTIMATSRQEAEKIVSPN